jgi:hypothetical protein
MPVDRLGEPESHIAEIPSYPVQYGLAGRRVEAEGLASHSQRIAGQVEIQEMVE